MIEDNQVKMEGDFKYLKSHGLDFEEMLKTYEKKGEEDKDEDRIFFDDEEEYEDSFHDKSSQEQSQLGTPEIEVIKN